MESPFGACGTACVSLQARGRERPHAAIARVEDIDWREGDAESLPFDDASFDVVLSQFGHIFAPPPEVVVREMLRVLRPGGTIAFATWPPEHIVGELFTLVGRFGPPPPAGAAPPPLWGSPAVVTERLGAAVRDVFFQRGTMRFPALSPQPSSCCRSRRRRRSARSGTPRPSGSRRPRAS